MRRFFSLILILVLLLTVMFTFSACGKGECEMCGQTEKLNTYNSGGSSMKLCDDCYRLAKFMGS